MLSGGLITPLIANAATYEYQSSNKEKAESRASNTNTITRVEWLKELTTLFEMTVEDDNYPDNYFSDLDSSSDYYYDMLLAVEFGLVAVEVGNPIYPENEVTREFAAQTLNFCLGYQLDENTQYSFSDVDAVEYDDDAQVALNRGWFKLVSGKFEPETRR